MNKKKYLSKLGLRIIIVLLLITPFLNYIEIRNIFLGGNISKTVALTPMYIKMIKDLLILMLVTIGLIGGVLFLNLPMKIFLISIYLSIIFSFMFKGSLILTLSGLRWLYPFIIIIFYYNIHSHSNMRVIAKIMLFLFIIGFILQVIEFFYMPHFYGSFYSRFSSRNPGFYLVPSSMAIFSIYTYFINTFYLNKSRLLLFIITASIVLTGSGTGLISIIVLELFVSSKFNTKSELLLVVIVVLVLLFLFLPLLTHREDIYTSVLTRGKIFMKYFKLNKIFISLDFGIGTNTGILFANYLSEDVASKIVDSQISSVLVNTGVFGLLSFVLFVISVANSKQGYAFVFFNFLIMLGSIIFELFPVNLLFAICYVDLVKQKYKNKKNAYVAKYNNVANI